MAPLGYNFRAIRDIDANGVRAYSTGDLVHEAAVTGPDAWLSAGTDVEPLEGARLDEPARNASQGSWAAFAVSRGCNPDEAAGMSRAALISEFAADGN